MTYMNAITRHGWQEVAGENHHQCAEKYVN